MQKQLDKVIEKFKNSQTTLESYEAISDFVKIIATLSEFIEEVETGGEKIRIEQIELNLDKGWNYGLKGKELKLHNEYRARKSEALHQLDLVFPLRNLNNVHLGIQSENIANNSDWLFRWSKPDEPMRESDKKEYQGFINKLYKKILPFLGLQEERISFGFDSEKSVLYFHETEIPISLKNDKSNAHYILTHIFKTDDIGQDFPFTEIAEDTFNEDNEKWRKYYRACEDINKKVYKATKIDDFLEFSSGKSAWVRINKKYLQ